MTHPAPLGRPTSPRGPRTTEPNPRFLSRLYETRSVLVTARELGIPEREALRTTMIAFGLGMLDYRLHDF